MRDETTIRRMSFLGFLAVILMLTVSLGGYWIRDEHRRFKIDSARLEEGCLASGMAELKGAVRRTIGFIDFQRKRTEPETGEELRHPVLEASAIDSEAYESRRGIPSLKRIERMVVERLKAICFDGVALFHSKAQYIGRYLPWRTPSQRGELRRRLTLDAGAPEAASLTYLRDTPGQPQPVSRMAYAVAYNNWQRIVGSGAPAYGIDKALQQKRVCFEKRGAAHVQQILIALSLFIGGAVILSNHFAKQLGKEFQAFAALLRDVADMRKRSDKNDFRIDEFREQAVSANKTIKDREQAEEKRHSIFENAFEGVFQTGPDGRFIDANPAMAHILGFGSPGELVGSGEELGDGLFSTPEVYDEFVSLIAQGNAVSGFEAPLRLRTGRKMWASLYARGVFSPDGKLAGIEGFLTDITERKKMEEELLKARKLESIGVLAGGIAHDFNNLLGVILGYVNLAAMNLPPEHPVIRLLGEAEGASLQARDLTQRFIILATGGNPVKTRTSIPEMLDGEVSAVLKDSRVEVRRDLPRDLWEVDVDQEQAGQAIRNVILNAREAMRDEGVLRIYAQNVEVSDGGKGLGIPIKNGRYAALSIRDEGVGIPSDDMDRIFDAYFSTKDRGSVKGMGLGLTITHSVISKHGGAIAVESEPGFGTIFCMYLPASAPSQVHDAQVASD